MGRRRGNGCWCIRKCIVPSFFTVENKLPAARAGRAHIYFFFALSLSLSLSVSLRERPRLYIWRLKRLYYCRATPADRKSHHSDLRRDRSEGLRTITRTVLEIKSKIQIYLPSMIVKLSSDLSFLGFIIL